MIFVCDKLTKIIMSTVHALCACMRAVLYKKNAPIFGNVFSVTSCIYMYKLIFSYIYIYILKTEFNDNL